MNFLPARRVAQFGIAGALVAGVAGVAHFDKSVDLSVDGKTHSVHAFAGTVGDLLADEGVKVGSHDLVVPGLNSPLSDGQKVVVRYGRKLTVTIDGAKKEYWTTATTVGDALAELGLRADDAVLLKIKVGSKDLVNPSLDTPLKSGMKLTVTRVDTKTVKKTTKIGYDTIRKNDSTLYKGETKVVTAGREGARVTTYAYVLHDGKVVKKTKVSSKVTVTARDAVLAVGSKTRPATTSWLAWGGADFAPRADLASREQQITVANRYYAVAGLSPWGCAHAA